MDILILILIALAWGITIPFIKTSSSGTKIFSLIGGLSLVLSSIRMFVDVISNGVVNFSLALDSLIDIEYVLHVSRSGGTLILLSSILLTLFIMGAQKGSLRRSSISASFFAFTGVVLTITARNIVGFFLAYEVASIALYYIMPIRSNAIMRRIQSVIIITSGVMFVGMLYLATQMMSLTGNLSLTIESLKTVAGINTPGATLAEVLFWTSTIYILCKTVLFPASLWQSKFAGTLGSSSIALYITFPAIAAYTWFSNFSIELQSGLITKYHTGMLILFGVGALYNILISLGQRKLERDAVFFSSFLLSFILGNVFLLSAEGARSGLIGIVFLALFNSYISVIISSLDRVFGSTLLPLCERSNKYSGHFLRGIIIVFLMIMGIPGGVGFTFFYSSLVAGVNHSNCVGAVMLGIWILLMTIVIQKVKTTILFAPKSSALSKERLNKLELFIVSLLVVAFVLGGLFPGYLFG